ncbi:lipoate-protein ligase A [Emiliania huxleyi CCMP1516]|uniref:BPL/LPL catalytic domain-containing protein n=2 Tax=Emiliania huxleyi TaxID=2903 RepID=A0A0D3KH32_EMIH1|nr:lipoate-protein ligase A [Emiliania huxleyi CCMP1516]EOD35067.1 lipoate-protein ligase A [Emiliania huxleyi CCMP1516]|eukprot:XP_005787496.1 lipoate-protein ligase A [Emiliania huxleyi CCMP1516]
MLSAATQSLSRTARRCKTCVSFLAPPTATDAIDILYAESEDILLNLATEEYLFEHVDIRNPLLLLWRNRPCIIIGKHQNPWKECRVQLLEQDGVTLARRPTGGDSGFSFINPHASVEDQRDYKTMNNGVLLEALARFGLGAEMSGRNDLTVDGRKVSGSAYKLRLGSAGGAGRRADAETQPPPQSEPKTPPLHRTMLLDVDLAALGRYLTVNKLKMQSKGVASVAARVLNLRERVPSISHDAFCDAAAAAFEAKRTLSVSELDRIPQLMQIYER